MKTVGLVVEYNPLHNGHLYHFQEAKRVTGADACVIVMSGNFLQRGEPALVSKWARAEMALAVGVDLVLELPVPFATATAELFAHGAISLLDRLGVVDCICFGSESGELVWLDRLATLLATEPAAFSAALKDGLSTGMAYPTAYAQAATRLMQAEGYGELALDQPNNILGLNYLLSLKRLQSDMQAVTIKRQKAGYHQETITDAQIASATAIRKMIFGKGKMNIAQGADLSALSAYLPPSTVDILIREFASGHGPMSWERFVHPLFHRLLLQSPAQLAEYLEVGEGIEHRLKQTAKTAQSVEQLLKQVKTRRFTWNRLQRMLLAILLDVRKTDAAQMHLKNGAAYARVLGFSEQGQKLLRLAKAKARIPVYTKVVDGLHPMLDVDLSAAAVYRLAQPKQGDDPFREEYRRSPLARSSTASSHDAQTSGATALAAKPASN